MLVLGSPPPPHLLLHLAGACQTSGELLRSHTQHRDPEPSQAQRGGHFSEGPPSHFVSSWLLEAPHSKYVTNRVPEVGLQR